MSIGSEDAVHNSIRRRLERALMDLGLHEAFPASWLSFQDDSCNFSPVSIKAISRLVAHLEDAAQILPYENALVYEANEPKIKAGDSLKTLVEYHEYQSIPVGYHTPQIKVG